MVLRACNIGGLYKNKKDERTQRNKARQEELIKIIEKDYELNRDIKFDELKQNGHTKEMLNALYWIIERYEFALEYIETVDKNPLARKRRFSSMLDEL